MPVLLSCLLVAVEITCYSYFRETQHNQNYTPIVNYFSKMVCKAIELLVTYKLVIFGLNFQCHFRYDQPGNVLLWSAVMRLKQDRW